MAYRAFVVGLSSLVRFRAWHIVSFFRPMQIRSLLNEDEKTSLKTPFENRNGLGWDNERRGSRVLR